MGILLDLDLNLNELCEKNSEELALIARTNKKAVEILVLRCLKTVFFKAKMISDRTEVDADDLQQEGLIGLLKAIASFNADRGFKFSTFAEICIINQMRTFLAKSGKNLISYESIDELPEEFAADWQTPENIYITRELFSELWYAVDNLLSENEYKIFKLCICGASYREIAGKFGISEKAVDNAMQRARRKIRRYIDNIENGQIA
ncbi:MAG: sigma-70 family RNA polymerase sigma factor [Ruminococcus sp.]|nr:sigma-70 family RNA polymerase sigma factor [Ruminococcus sp.]